MTLNDAIEQAQSSGLDLVEVSPNSDPPVCRVMDYGKFVFEQNKIPPTAWLVVWVLTCWVRKPSAQCLPNLTGPKA